MYLPESHTSKTEKHPVLYLQDAQNLFDISTSYAGEWKVDETLDSLGLDLIVIGIEHGNDKRIDELTPFPHPEYKGGKADAYLDFVLNTLRPKVDSLYNTSTTAENTFIGGSSLGGLFSYYATLKHPDVFSKAIVFSPSFWYSEDVFSYVESIESEDIEDLQFYFRAGEKESETMLPLMFKMKELLSSKLASDTQINIDSIPDGEHNEKLWAKSFPDAALWLLNLDQ
ncbi:alpha/beta hydrolase [Gillisia sp. JM1]|uniref:alpha/beta hydrolase n=1 Tax=Gillisia sp. JM1 TaxID=1283286 RepID=UPI000413BBDC|nr:alpha/beta hydrolase-fold protein [Gillisia sp. JM1]